MSSQPGRKGCSWTGAVEVPLYSSSLQVECARRVGLAGASVPRFILLGMIQPQRGHSIVGACVSGGLTVRMPCGVRRSWAGRCPHDA